LFRLHSPAFYNPPLHTDYGTHHGRTTEKLDKHPTQNCRRQPSSSPRFPITPPSCVRTPGHYFRSSHSTTLCLHIQFFRVADFHPPSRGVHRHSIASVPDPQLQSHLMCSITGRPIYCSSPEVVKELVDIPRHTHVMRFFQSPTNFLPLRPAFSPSTHFPS